LHTGPECTRERWLRPALRPSNETVPVFERRGHALHHGATMIEFFPYTRRHSLEAVSAYEPDHVTGAR
jgi:hypothetical protein